MVTQKSLFDLVEETLNAWREEKPETLLYHLASDCSLYFSPQYFDLLFLPVKWKELFYFSFSDSALTLKQIKLHRMLGENQTGQSSRMCFDGSYAIYITETVFYESGSQLLSKSQVSFFLNGGAGQGGGHRPLSRVLLQCSFLQE